MPDVTLQRILNEFAKECVQDSMDVGWTNPADNVPRALLLIHSEISEACEAHRKDLMDDKLPHRTGLEVELADAILRIFNLAGGLGIDLGGAVVEKKSFNKTRADHSAGERAKPHGKKY